MGPVLYLECDLAQIGVHAHAAGQTRIYISLEIVPADVCRNRNLDRQRATQQIKTMGAVDSQAMQEAVSGEADAGFAVPGLGIGRRIAALRSVERKSKRQEPIHGDPEELKIYRAYAGNLNRPVLFPGGPFSPVRFDLQFGSASVCGAQHYLFSGERSHGGAPRRRRRRRRLC